MALYTGIWPIFLSRHFCVNPLALLASILLNEKENINLKLHVLCFASHIPPSQGIQLLKLIEIHHSGMLSHWPRTGRGNYVSVLRGKVCFTCKEAFYQTSKCCKADQLLQNKLVIFARPVLFTSG